MSPRNKIVNGPEDTTNTTTTLVNNGSKKNKISFWMKKIMSNSNSSSSSTHNTTTIKVMSSPKRHSGEQLPIKTKSNTNIKYSYSHSQQHKSNNTNNNNNIHRRILTNDPEDDRDSDDNTINFEQLTTNSSIKPIFNKDILETGSINTITTTSVKKLQWDEEPERTKSEYHSSSNINNSNDIASTAPIISFYSSSMRSPSMFSDMNSIQSTRPTVMSVKTIETNSSVMAIPPASIIDRARPRHTIESSASITS